MNRRMTQSSHRIAGASVIAKCSRSPALSALLAFLLHELPDGRVAVRGLPQFPLPQTCASRAWLGLRCPGCGLTRSIIHLAEGDWQASWRDHRLGGLLAVVIAASDPLPAARPSPARPTLVVDTLAGRVRICSDRHCWSGTGWWIWRRVG